MSAFRKSVLVAALAISFSASAADTYQLVTKIPGLKSQGEPAPFQSLSFSNCGQEGRMGPSQAACESAYSGQAILDPSLSFSVAGGIQSWFVPVSGNYKIEAWGAQGGSIGGYQGGKGAKAESVVSLTEGDNIRVLVGQVGTGAGAGAGGGGGTYVVKGSTPLVVAGGGGGATAHSNTHGFPGRATTSGGDSSSIGGYCNKGGSGGANGYGGSAGCAAGGSGWLSNGANGSHQSVGGARFLSGGAGGDSTNSNGKPYGGFGGGGAGSPNNGYGGGGGGYSGGGGGSWNNQVSGNGGGGGSLGDTNTTGVNLGHGKVVITFVSD